MMDTFSKTLRGNLATMMMLTVAEVSVFYLFYKKRNQTFVDRTIRSAFRSNESALAYIRTQPKSRRDDLYTWAMRMSADREHATFARNREVLRITVVACLLIGMFAILPFGMISEPISSDQWRSMGLRSVFSTIGVLVTQYVLVTFFFEKTRGLISYRVTQETKARLRRYANVRYDDDDDTCAPSY